MARIGIVGGGVAGLACGWALAREHDVTLFEAAPALGGHARTVEVEPGLWLDTGVILYERRNFPVAHRLLEHLELEVRRVPGATGMYLDPRRSWLSPFGLRDSGRRIGPRRALHLLPMIRERRAFRARVAEATHEELLERPVSAYLADDDFSTWMLLLLMYAWSTPFPRTPELPAAMAVPMLTAFLAPEQWTAIVGGSRALVNALARPIRSVWVGARVDRVERDPDSVRVILASGGVHRFDQIVLAAGPDRVLELLADPTPAEQTRFAPWAADDVETVIHRDDGPWVRRGLEYRSEFDLFRTARGDHGYNACLNRIAGLPCGPPWYGLAFRLDGEIDRPLWVQRHRVPRYTVEAVKQVDDVLIHNGDDRTWHAGAWLGDGLQEGAIHSGLAVAAALSRAPALP